MAQKTVVLGVSACIGVYKACYIVRGLQKAGLRVRVVMTQHATELVTPLTFEALTHEKVLVGMYDDATEDAIPHITLANEADLMIIAPCTANVCAKLSTGIADDLLSSAALAMHCPMLIAPAANMHMYNDETMQGNLSVLRARGWNIIEGGKGYLACGDEGYGRMAEPDEIVAAAFEMLQVNPDLAGKRILITAGPTREPIDPVRFITNYSSGKTGYALAEAAAERGGEVVLVTGPTVLDDPQGVKVVHVNTALEMLQACEQEFENVDIAIFSAAVSDARPAEVADHKLKKGIDDDALSTIHLVENPDILATLAANRVGQVVIGYAAETNDVIENARKKLLSKHADCIVANAVSPTRGFGTDENSIFLVDVNSETKIENSSKTSLAHMVLDKALSILLEKQS